MQYTNADIVCSRAKYHFDPGFDPNSSDTATQTSRGASSNADSYLETYKEQFKGLHQNQKDSMYFVVSYCVGLALCTAEKLQ